MSLSDIIDTVGTELADPQAVVREARCRALDTLRQGFALGEDRRDWVMVVRDETGAPLMRITLGEAAGTALATVLN